MSAPPRRRSHHRQPWNATSSKAWVGEPPDDDDPLLGFAPFIHPRPKRTSITPDLQRRFIATLAATGIVAQAARSIGKSMEALYALRKRPGAEGFAAAWDEAARWGLGRLEDCALERVLSPDHWAYMHEGREGRGEALLLHVLRQRSGFMVDVRDLVPGHPAYERIRAEVLGGHGAASRARERSKRDGMIVNSGTPGDRRTVAGCDHPGGHR